MKVNHQIAILYIAESAAATGAAAGEELVKNLKEGGCVDEHLQDQVSETFGKGLLEFC